MRAKGFTLIELLVVMTIVVLLSGAGLATFLNFQKRRQVQDDAANLADRLRTIQIRAAAVAVPEGCTTVSNYTVTLTGANLTVGATCQGGLAVAVPELALTLGNSSINNGPLTIVFDSRSVSAGPATVNVCGNSILYRVTVNEAANVSRPVFVAGGC